MVKFFYRKKSLQIFDLNPFDLFFFLVCFYGAKVQKKKAQLLFNENSRQCFAQTENSSPIPIWKTWILKTQSLLGSHSIFYSNCKHSGYQLFEELKQNFNLKWHKNPFVFQLGKEIQVEQFLFITHNFLTTKCIL